ncbi:hypothetical protein CRUP_001341 [Coryphaenoides rupestris]|nr:hypothetical protein CRUP_001341 [Coryphaenoides rupestris]
MVISLLILGLLTGIQRTYGHPNAAVFAAPGDNVALPCAIPSLKSCSKVNWNVSGEFPGLYTEVIKAAVFAAPGDNVALPCAIPSLKSCSKVNWNVSGEFPGLYTEVIKAGVLTAEQPPTVRMSANCSLHIDNFKQSDAGMYVCGDGQFSAGLSLEILQNGIEEVFAVAGERVSFACDTSSAPVDSLLKWSRPPHDSGSYVDGVTSHPEFTLNPLDFSLAVNKVSPGHAGDYECLDHDQVLAKFRLHTLEVSAEQDGGNLTVCCHRHLYP